MLVPLARGVLAKHPAEGTHYFAQLPTAGGLRYFFESIRPELRQYFFESGPDGRPFSRRQRSIVYQRAKDVRQPVPFGMLASSQEVGYEWIAHAMFPVPVRDKKPRVTIGSSQCRQPCSASLYNISAMSYGSLSQTAIRALSGGARLGGFAHNTGEGGVSPCHLEGGGDLIWQIGTGYFGCRDALGGFSSALFKEQARHPHIKMVEIKLSQEAKPGHSPAGLRAADGAGAPGSPAGTPQLVAALARELTRAHLITSYTCIPSVITLNAQVSLWQPDSGGELPLTVVCPALEDEG